MTSGAPRFSFHSGWFRGARKLWNCLALHVVIDHAEALFHATIAIPGLFTMTGQCPIAGWLLPWAAKWAGGYGERAEYGVWHDYHETKLQWRRVINLPLKRGGYEGRWIHDHGPVPVSRNSTLMTALVSDVAQAWVVAHDVDTWRLDVSTWHAPSAHWWIPSLYDHFFYLKAVTHAGHSLEASIKKNITKRLTPEEVFRSLTAQLSYD